MASWMVHLRVAQIVMDRLPIENKKLFVIGNLAPDCGEPTGEGRYEPPKSVTHFKGIDGNGEVDAELFKRQYLDNAEPEKFDFYLGYYCHLLTDRLWSSHIAKRTKDKFHEEYETDPKFWRNVKQDWYDLDHLFIRDNQNFYPFQVVLNTESFENSYLDFYSLTAIDVQLKFISVFYGSPQEGLDHEYKYLDQKQMDDFVHMAGEEISNTLKYLVIPGQMC